MFHFVWVAAGWIIRNRRDIERGSKVLWQNRDILAGAGLLILAGAAVSTRVIRLKGLENRILNAGKRVRNYRETVQAEKRERKSAPPVRRIGPPPNKRYSSSKGGTSMLQKIGLGLGLLILAPVALISSYLFQQISVSIDLYLLKNGANILIGLAFWVLGIAVVYLYLRVRKLDGALRDLMPTHEEDHHDPIDHDTDDHGEDEDFGKAFMPPFGAK